MGEGVDIDEVEVLLATEADNDLSCEPRTTEEVELAVDRLELREAAQADAVLGSPRVPMTVTGAISSFSLTASTLAGWFASCCCAH